MTTSPGAASTSYDVDAILPTLTGLDPRYRGSAAIHRVTGLDSKARFVIAAPRRFHTIYRMNRRAAAPAAHASRSVGAYRFP